MVKEAVWTTLTTALGAIFHLAQLMIAARYFSPEEFGTLAIVNVMQWIVTGLQDMGLSSYCIYSQDTSRRTHSTLFWVSLVVGCLAALFIIIIAIPLKLFYGMPDLAQLLYILSIYFIILGFSGQYQAQFIKAFKSIILAKIELVARAFSFLLVYYLIVFEGLGPIAIIAGLVMFGFTKLIFMIINAISEWHPTMEFDRVIAPAALRYGSYQASTVVISQLGMQLDQLVIGKVLGAETVGYYSLAKELLSYPMRFILPVISRLIMPRLAANQKDPVELRKGFLGAMRLTMTSSCVLHTVILIFSPWIVEIMYGSRFMVIVPLLGMMTVYATLRPVGYLVGVLAQATGKTNKEFYWNIFIWPMTIPFLLVVMFYYPSAEAFAINLSLVQVMITIMIYPIFLSQLDKVGFGRYILILLPTFIISVFVTVITRQFSLPRLSLYIDNFKLNVMQWWLQVVSFYDNLVIN